MASKLPSDMLSMHLSELFRFMNNPALADQEPDTFLDENAHLTSLTRELLVARNLQHEVGHVRARAIRNGEPIITRSILKADIRYARHQLGILGIETKAPEAEGRDDILAADIRQEFEGYLCALKEFIQTRTQHIAENTSGFCPQPGQLMQWFREKVQQTAETAYGYGALAMEQFGLDGSERQPQETVQMHAMRALMHGLQQMCRDEDYRLER